MAKAKAPTKRNPPAKKPAKAAPSRAAKPAPKPAKTKMAAFSAKVLAEEDEAVQVRTFNEARAGIEASAEFTPKTGAVKPLDEAAPSAKASAAQLEEFLAKRSAKPAAPAELEFEPETPSPTPTRSLDRKSERLVAATKRCKPTLETPEDYGKVELRQATASGGRKVAALHKDNLQRAAERLKPLASAEETKPDPKARAKPDAFEVAQDAAARAARLPDITDFGEVEIGQQTLSGSRRVGRLKPKDADDTH